MANMDRKTQKKADGKHTPQGWPSVTIEKVILKCDSWSKIEDRGAEIKDGRFGITVYFDARADADEFSECIKCETLRS